MPDGIPLQTFGRTRSFRGKTVTGVAARQIKAVWAFTVIEVALAHEPVAQPVSGVSGRIRVVAGRPSPGGRSSGRTGEIAVVGPAGVPTVEPL